MPHTNRRHITGTAVLLLLPTLGCTATLGPEDDPSQTATTSRALFISREISTGPLVFDGEARLAGTTDVAQDGLSIPTDAITLRFVQDDSGLSLDLSGGPLAEVTTLVSRDGARFSGDLPVNLRPLAGTPGTERLCPADLGVVLSPATIGIDLRDGTGEPTASLAAAARVRISVDVTIPGLRTALGAGCLDLIRVDVVLSASVDRLIAEAPAAPGPGDGACTHDGDCPAGAHCAAGTCVVDGPPTPAPVDPGDGGECVVDSDCGDSARCVDAMCIPHGGPTPPSDDPPPPPAEEPAAPGCTTDADCAAGTACVLGTCRAVWTPPPPDDADLSACEAGVVSRHGEPCAGIAPETWRCVCDVRFDLNSSQVCRDGIWQTYHLRPRDCGSCRGAYSVACRAGG